MSKQNYVETVYIDAFAGSGTIPFSERGGLLKTLIDADEFAVGSALRAINLDNFRGMFSLRKVDKN